MNYLSDFEYIKNLKTCPKCRKEISHQGLNDYVISSWSCCNYEFINFSNNPQQFIISLREYTKEYINFRVVWHYYVRSKNYDCYYQSDYANDHTRYHILVKCPFSITDLITKDLSEIVDEAKLIILFN